MMQAIIFDYVGTLTTNADEAQHVVRPEAAGIIAQLAQRYRLGLISKTKDPDARIHELQALPFAHYFDHFQSCREKTPEVVATALKALKTTGPRCYALDDRVKNFPSFNTAGCKTLWLQQGTYASEGPQIEQERPHRVILSLQECLNI